MKKTVLAIFAHPDDNELFCSGTLSLLRKLDWQIHIVTLSPGDKGTISLDRNEIAKIRKDEAAKAAKLIGATYQCLEFQDIYIQYNRDSINKVTAIIRKIQPSIVITSSPIDYMLDHEITSLLVQTGCFCSGIKNMDIEEPIFSPVPYLYYCDAMEGKDKLGRSLGMQFCVDVSGEMRIKMDMLRCHQSQESWLKNHHRVNDFLSIMQDLSAMRGKEINVDYGEGYNQHLGHGFPKDNIMQMLLPDYVHQIPQNVSSPHKTPKNSQ